MITYNQNIDKYSSMWCPVYWLAHTMLINYWIKVYNNFLLSVLHYYEKIKVWSSKDWWSFNKVYNTSVNEINNKLWINTKLLERKISNLIDWDTLAYWIWMPNYHSWLNLIKDWSFDKDDVESFLLYKWKTVWHHLCWTWKDWWYLINSNWSKPIKCSLEILKYMVSKWIIRDTARAIIPNDESTRNIFSLTKNMLIAENSSRLSMYLETNKDNKFLTKAKELFFYWRK